jgi:sulfide:quinone oxidoreductase
MTPKRVLIAGGGVAALETMLALRHLAGDRVEIVIVSPDDSFAYRPLTVAEPFGLGTELRFDLAEIAADGGAELVREPVASVDAATRTVRTGAGASLDYDALVIACGGRRRAPFAEAVTFWGPGGRERMSGLLDDLRGGRVGSVAFVLPGGCGWPLPLYELTLLTSSWLAAEEAAAVELMLVTPEAAPLELFGPDASGRIAGLLAARRIGLFTGSYPSAFHAGELRLSPAGRLRVERIVTLPRIEGPGIAGLPKGPHGFIPVDDYGRVRGLEGVYAAGDATTVPIKQGGLAAQMADVAARQIALEAGVDVEAEQFRPILRGMLLTGETPRYLRADLEEGTSDRGLIADHALWWPPSKIAGRYLSPYLASLTTQELAPAPSAREPVSVAIELDARRAAEGR